MESVAGFDGPDPEEPILRYLIELPAAFAPHSGATLFHHLLGTYRILRHWHCEEHVCVAGLFHSIYGTPAYPDGPLSGERREELKWTIGAAAEDLVYRFSCADWPSILAGGEATLASLPPSLLTVAAANLVEQYERLERGDGAAWNEGLAPFALLIPHLSPVAASCLARELQLRGKREPLR